MTERFRAHLAESGLVPEGATVLVGYSGGADSTCLLHLLAEAGVDQIACHLHHGQRPEADEEMERCAAECDRLGVPFISGRADVPMLAEDRGIGIEEAGRRARYEFFEQCLHSTDASLVATAHTQDDHVETVLLNIVRGTGLHGLAGIPAKRDDIIRPLLPFSRAETRAYCEGRSLWFHDDPANEETAFSRVRVRRNVLPELEAINPAVRDAVCRLAATAEAEDKFLNGMSAAALERAEVELNGQLSFLTKDCEIAFDRAALTGVPEVLLSRAIRLVTGVLGQRFDFAQTQAVIQGLRWEERGSVTAEGGRIVVEWTRERVIARSLEVAEPFRFPLTIPGETVSDTFGWKFIVQTAGPENYLREPGSLDVVLDADAVTGGMFFRSYEDGDTIVPLGSSTEKKVSDVVAGLKLSQAARRRLPVVYDETGAVWVPGGCIGERVKVTVRAKRCFRLTLGPI